MQIRFVAAHSALALSLLLPVALASTGAHADTAAANTCAAKLSKDAKAIFDKTLPQVTPTSDLKALLTSSTRSLAIAGTINRGNARASATAAAPCLQAAEK